MRLFKTAREKQHVANKGTPLRQKIFSAQTLQARGKRYDLFKVLKMKQNKQKNQKQKQKKRCNLGYSTQQRSHLE